MEERVKTLSYEVDKAEGRGRRMGMSWLAKTVDVPFQGCREGGTVVHVGLDDFDFLGLELLGLV